MRKKREENFITIKDVAKDAGVSIATVSRVINEGKVSEKRKKAVLESIKKLDYEPNNSARNLASVNNTKRIALVVPTLGYRSYIDMIKGFKEGTKLYNYDSIIQDYEFDYNNYEYLNSRFIVSSEIKGIVQIGPREELSNKVVVDLEDDLFEYNVDEKLLNKKVGIYFPNDKYFSNFFAEIIYQNKDCTVTEDVTKLNSSCDYYLTQTAEEAAALINNGFTKTIYTLEPVSELTKVLKQIESLEIDFYLVGMALSRIVIKRLTNRVNEEDQSLEINIGV